MLFNSVEFVILVAVVFAFYYLPGAIAPARPERWRLWQVLLLIAGSFIFYAFHHPPLLILLIASIAINALSSRMVFRSSRSHAKWWAAGGLIANLLVLGFFKYAALFMPWWFTTNPQHSLVEQLIYIPLPIGISFFTFQGMSLVADTWRSRDDKHFTTVVNAHAATHWTNTTLFIAFFPQLVAGPIVKAHEFYQQIAPKRLAQIEWEYCFRCLVLGYFLKMVVADNLKDLTFWIKYPEFTARASLDLAAMLFAFSMQIFADFAGYSLIALGIAGLFGYMLPTNFNFPYVAESFSDFWRRWHISLSSWLRDYLYIPLGGNRKGRVRTYINLFLVMFLGGLWHGAAWSYAVWGTTHGLALAVERAGAKRIRMPNHMVIRIVRTVFVFTIVTLAWLLFQLPNFSEAVIYIQSIATNTQIEPVWGDVYLIIFFSLPIVLYHAFYVLRQGQVGSFLHKCKGPLYGLMLFLIATNSGSAGAFIYFQF